MGTAVFERGFFKKRSVVNEHLCFTNIFMFTVYAAAKIGKLLIYNGLI